MKIRTDYALGRITRSWSEPGTHAPGRNMQEVRCQVLTSSGILEAALAPSLLLEPVPGDRVLCLRSASGAVITAILSPDPESKRIAPRRVRLEHVKSLGGGPACHLTSGNLLLEGREIRSRSHHLATNAREIHQIPGSLFRESRNLLVKSTDLACSSQISREEISRISSRSAGSLQSATDNACFRHVGREVLTCRGEVDIDGSKINLG